MANKAEVNAACWSLVRQENIAESAQTLIEFSKTIPMSGRLNITYYSGFARYNFEGSTEEIKKRILTSTLVENPKEEWYKTFFINKVSVGKFDIWRRREFIIIENKIR